MSSLPSPPRPVPQERTPEAIPLRLPDGYQTTVVFHTPSCEPKRSPVIYLHGIQSHPAWFYSSAMALAAAGHPVYQPTRRGSALTSTPKGHATCPKQVLTDIDAAVELAMQRENVKKVHLLGVSLGGKLATAWALAPARQKKLLNLTLIAPGLCPKIKPSRQMKFAIMTALLTGLWKKQVPIPLNDPALFTDNPGMRKFLVDDPAQLHYATARFFSTMRRMDWMLRRAKENTLDCPVNLLLSERDRIIDNGETLELLGDLAGNTLNVRKFPGAHTLEFEEDPTEFFACLCSMVGEA